MLVLRLWMLWNSVGRVHPRTFYWLIFTGWLSITWGIVKALPLFGYPAPFEDMQNIMIFALSVLLCTTISCFVVYVIVNNDDGIVDIIEKLNKMLEEGRYKDILILRKKWDWSRSLWIEGKPYARLEIGEIAKKAAINLQDNKNLASIYIDDLGWTSVTIERYEDAKKFLVQGLRYAEMIHDNDDKYYWIAKAKRHLAGIELENMEYNNVDDLLNEAVSFANKISDEQRKNEMFAGIYHAQSVRFLKDSSNNKENIDTALAYAKKSELLGQKGESTRFIKIYSLKGNIYEAMNDKISAEEQYRTGLQKSEELKRVDEIIKNHLGLASVLESETEKLQHKKIARKLLKRTPVPYLNTRFGVKHYV